MNTAYEEACDYGHAVLKASADATIDEWRDHIGNLRVAVRELRRLPENDQPDTLIYWIEQRVEIYAGHAAHQAARDLVVESSWRFGLKYVDGPSELDTGILHGPAGRDIQWGCRKMPRFES